MRTFLITVVLLLAVSFLAIMAPAAAAQSTHQVVDGGVAQGATMWFAPQIHEHVIAFEVAILAVHVVGVEPDQLRADRDAPDLG